MITFNHEKVLAQALESALNQETTFPYEIVIGEDCSTDGTRAVLEDFCQRYPGRIRPIYQEKNLGCFGKYNFDLVWKACRGEYIAPLEGDDYWISPKKLQTVVDFLEKHPDSAGCFHNADVIQSDTGESRGLYWKDQQTVYAAADFFKIGFPTLASILVRKSFLPVFPEWFFKMKMSDWPIFLYTSQKGPWHFFNQTLSVYRLHPGSSWMTRTLLERTLGEMKAMKVFRHHLTKDYRPFIQAHLNRRFLYLCDAWMELGNPALAKKYFIKHCRDRCFGSWRKEASQVSNYSPRQVASRGLRLFFPKLHGGLKRLAQLVRKPV